MLKSNNTSYGKSINDQNDYSIAIVFKMLIAMLMKRERKQQSP